VIVAIPSTIFFSIATMVFSPFRRAEGIIKVLIRTWARTIVWAAGIDVRAEHLELIDPKQRYILIANHYSYFDIPCIFAAIPQPIRFMAKVSLFKIPIF
jgi:1-acyl-sn-glycerol-3-phosphate acyltransferase